MLEPPLLARITPSFPQRRPFSQQDLSENIIPSALYEKRGNARMSLRTTHRNVGVFLLFDTCLQRVHAFAQLAILCLHLVEVVTQMLHFIALRLALADGLRSQPH